MKLPIEVAREYLRDSDHDVITENHEKQLEKTLFEYALAILKYCEPIERNGRPAIKMKSAYLLLPEKWRSAFPKESEDFFGP